MKREMFRRLVQGARCSCRMCEVNPCESVTDPTLAMTGTELAVASMLGTPIPQPLVNYSFNSAQSPDDVGMIDSLRADPFDVYSAAQRERGSIEDALKVVQQSPEYQEFINSQKKD